MAPAFTSTSLTAHISIAQVSKFAETPSLPQLALIAALATFLLALTSSVDADEYHGAITKAFPGFQILSRTEFTEEIQKTVKTNPALVTGRFNDDDREDFAAIIRCIVKQRGERGIEYYLGKVVVCHGLGKGQYHCQVLIEPPIFLPRSTYLKRVDPGKVFCHPVGYIVIKQNAIGYELGNAASAYVYQPDGSYLNCVTAD